MKVLVGGEDEGGGSHMVDWDIISKPLYAGVRNWKPKI